MPDQKPVAEGDSGTGIPAGTARDGTETRPDIGGTASGRRQLKKAEQKPGETLSPEAGGGAGAGRHWPGDS
ncbi:MULTISPECIES: hypothetical protein [Roseomonadaceae]|uniref:Uncharacterized protein n=1 Tax=Falsiroseomonas oleicola TaxID=2801474 RepID=A0ABS6H7G6_9PROT|nr:hypothetical protein [Roseomonas oleicola]MBU8544644.1 hypothetical protein [Roseomonas oleicola]